MHQNCKLCQCEPVYSPICFPEQVSINRIDGLASGSAFQVDKDTITYRATSYFGITSTCSFTVSVLPALICPRDTTVNTDPNSCTAVFNYSIPGSACGSINVNQTDGFISGTALGVGTTVNSFTFTDENNNTSSCSFTVNVVNTNPPIVNCPANINVNVNPLNCGTTNVTYNTPYVTNACNNMYTISRIAGLASGVNYPLGNTLNTYTVTDDQGRKDTCSFTVTVKDNIAPILICLSSVVYLDPGQCTKIVNYSLPSASDRCSAVTLTRTSGKASGSAFSAGNNAITYKAVDQAGNSTSCTFYVNVVDDQPPTITCPPNITVSGNYNSNGYCGSIVTFNLPVGSDNCTGSLIQRIEGPGSGAFFPVGKDAVVYRITDSAGLSDSCRIIVTVNPCATAPVAKCKNISVYPGVNCQANILGTQVDNGSTDMENNIVSYILAPAGPFFSGNHSVVLTVKDAGGLSSTCNATIEVLDTIAPSILCPTNIVVNTNPGICGAVVNYSVSSNDNCPGQTVNRTAGQSSGTFFPKGLTTNTFLVTDVRGNTASCSFTVRVNDTVKPTITCNAPVVVSNNAGQCGAIVNYVITSTDNCPGQYVSRTAGLPSGSLFPKGITTNTFMVKDSSGNTATCSFTVTVNDTAKPTITCVAPVVVSNNPGQCGAIVNYVITSTDICPGQYVSRTAGFPSGSLFPKGITTNAFVVTDSSGNTATCSFTVTVNDNENPVISCPASAIRFTNTGLCSYKVQNTEFNASATDNCAVTSLTYVLTGATTGSGTGTMQTLKDVLLARGTTTVTLTAKDSANNMVSCSFTVIVKDDQNSTNYIIYASEEVEFGEYNYIGGDVGVTAASGKAKFKKNSVLDPFSITAVNINVDLPASVNNRILSPATGGPTPPFMAYNGNTTGLSNLEVTVNGTLNGNWKDVKVKKGITCAINGINFGKITIEEGAKVTFTAAVINLIEMDVQKGKKEDNILTVVNFSNPASVKVKDKVAIGDDCHVNVGGPKVTFYMGDNDGDDEEFKVEGKNSQVTANIMIPKGKLHVHGGNNIARPTLMTGWYIIEKLESHEKYIYWNKYSCSILNFSNDQQSSQLMIKPGVPAMIATLSTQPKDEFQVNAYPIPTAYEFNIQVISKSTEPVTVRILDLTGKVLSVHAQTKANSFRVGEKLISGTYIAEVIQGANRKTVKLVKMN